MSLLGHSSTRDVGPSTLHPLPSRRTASGISDTESSTPTARSNVVPDVSGERQAKQRTLAAEAASTPRWVSSVATHFSGSQTESLDGGRVGIRERFRARVVLANQHELERIEKSGRAVLNLEVFPRYPRVRANHR
jgi:hypothetical protein